MAVLRLYPTRYTEEMGATYQNSESVLNGLDPEDASNYSTYAALVYKTSGYSHYTARVHFYFTLPTNIDDLDVTSIVAKGKIASYGGQSTSCGSIFLTTGSLNFTATADHYSSAANAQAYMASSSYKTTPSITGSTLSSMLTKLKNGDSILKVQSYNDTSAPTYVSGVVLEIEYTPKDDQIKIGTSLLKKVKIGASQKIDKIFKGNTLLFKDKLLPKEYQRLQYIKTTGTQYFDTGLFGKPGLKTEAKLQVYNSTSASAVLVGARNDSGQTRCYLGYRQYNSSVNFGYQEEQQSGVAPTSDIDTFEYEIKSGELVIKKNSTTILDQQHTTTFTTDYTMYVFAINYTGSASQAISCDLYELKL